MTGRNTIQVWYYLLGEVTFDDMCIRRIHSCIFFRFVLGLTDLFSIWFPVLSFKVRLLVIFFQFFQSKVCKIHHFNP